MTHSALSLEGRTKTTLDVFGCSVRAFSEITAIPLVTLSNTLNGLRTFTTDEAERVEAALDAMAGFQERMNYEHERPVKIDWTRNGVAEIVAMRRVAKFLWLETGELQHKQRMEDYGIPRLRGL